MKKIILLTALLFPFIATAQEGTIVPLQKNGMPLFCIENGKVIADNHFIEQMRPRPSEENVSYQLAHPGVIQFSNVTYTVKTAKFTGWEQEPGDFNVIEISKSGERLYLLKEPLGIWNFRNSWRRGPQGYTTDYVRYADDDAFMTIPLSDQAKALVFLGHPYGDGYGRVFIFVLTPNDVKLVFNKSITVMSIEKENNSVFSLTARMAEYKNVNGQRTNQIRTVTIWKKDGALWIKDN